jgi:CHRD domain
MTKLVLLLGASMLVFTGIAFAASPVMVGTKLDAMQDHATSSHGKGSFTADITGKKLTFTLKFSGLTGAASAAHIHLGAKGKAGPVIIPLCGPCKAKVSGTVHVTATQIKQIESGKTYVNVNTAKYPNGEIRGQLVKG